MRVSAAAIASLALDAVPKIAGQKNKALTTFPPVIPFSLLAYSLSCCASENSFCNCAHVRPESPGFTLFTTVGVAQPSKAIDKNTADDAFFMIFLFVFKIYCVKA